MMPSNGNVLQNTKPSYKITIHACNFVILERVIFEYKNSENLVI